MPVGDVCRQVGISEQTFYRWKKSYGGMLPSDGPPNSAARVWQPIFRKRLEGPIVPIIFGAPANIG